MSTKMLAWHSSAALKAEVMGRLRDHRKEDEFIQGNYQVLDSMAASGYRGCAIGCTLPVQRSVLLGGGEPNWHREVERLYGIDYSVAIVVDNLFEDLPVGLCGDFAVNVIEAIPVGADLSGVLGAWRGRRGRGDETAMGWAAANLIKCLHEAPVPVPVLAPVLVPA